MKKILFISLIGLVIFAIIGAALAPGISEKKALKEGCTYQKKITISDLNGNVVAGFLSPKMRSHFRKEDDSYVLYLDDPGQYNKFYQEYNAMATKANSQLDLLYVRDEAFPAGGATFSPIQEDRSGAVLVSVSDRLPACPTPSIEGSPLFFNIRFDRCDPDSPIKYYCIETEILGDDAYVTMNTAGGSFVKYAFPAKMLDQVIYSSFGTGEPVDLHPEFTPPDQYLVDDTAYAVNQIESVLNDSQAKEVIVFNLVASDLAGRNELRSGLEKAMQVTAAQIDHPVQMILKGTTLTGQYSYAKATYHQDGINIKQHNGLLYSDTSISGGGIDFEGIYNSHPEDVVSGSIYILNP